VIILTGPHLLEERVDVKGKVKLLDVERQWVGFNGVDIAILHPRCERLGHDIVAALSMMTRMTTQNNTYSLALALGLFTVFPLFLAALFALLCDHRNVKQCPDMHAISFAHDARLGTTAHPQTTLPIPSNTSQ